MYNFLLTQWKLGKIDEAYLQSRVTKGQITEAEYEEIINTPRV